MEWYVGFELAEVKDDPGATHTLAHIHLQICFYDITIVQTYDKTEKFILAGAIDFYGNIKNKIILYTYYCKLR